MTVVCEVTPQMLLRRGNRWRVTWVVSNKPPPRARTIPSRFFKYRWVSPASKEGAVSKKGYCWINSEYTDARARVSSIYEQDIFGLIHARHEIYNNQSKEKQSFGMTTRITGAQKSIFTCGQGHLCKFNRLPTTGRYYMALGALVI